MSRLLAVALFAVFATGASAQSGPDGLWTVDISVTRGECPQGASFPVRVASGRITYAGNLDIEASGTVASDGRVRGTVRRGADSLTANGRIAGRAGQGQWTSPTRGCAGTWRAQRM